MAKALLTGDDSKKYVSRHPSWMLLPQLLVLACIASWFFGYAFGRYYYPTSNAHPKRIKSDPCLGEQSMRNQGVPTFKYRHELGSIVENENMTIGVELGVQRGLFSKAILQLWPSCREYHMVDLWAHQEHYEDVANVDQTTQNHFYN